MKILFSVFLFTLALQDFTAKAETPVSVSEAREIVAAEVESKKIEREVLIRALLKPAAVAEWERRLNDGGRSLFRLLPQMSLEPLEKVLGSEPDDSFESPSANPTETTPEQADQERTITPVVTVYGDEFAVMRWPFEGKTYSVLSCPDLRYLSMLSSVDTDGVSLNLFPTVSEDTKWNSVRLHKWQEL